ncbi:hypothetical protein GCM10011309_25940 [Litorimonas cladophorae]|uniref:Uncharacterized protein n=1 Tax=Litorimonas cladophorae TaxID=1220491 RepID=A0A918KRX5_9PROT|nr:hypothetical protein [Litorimonas cladophorae]GGX74593.1 hypothetical protein GCM10011309_25940 [Litorimonas cladophorae]
MLKDRYFYPLAAIIVAAMIVFALSLGERIDLTDREIWDNGYTMEGEELVRLTAQPGTQAIYVAAAGGESAFARLSSTAARESLPPGPGVFAPLGPQYERAFATRLLRMTVTARASRINPLEHFDMGYFSAGSGDSGWTRRELTESWTDYSIEFRPGALTAQQGLDHASVWPGEMAEVLNMDVKKIRVEVLDPPS